MFELAKAKAKNIEPRKIRKESGDGFYVGYALTQAELSNLFFMEGFIREATIKKYQEIWLNCGWAVRASNHVLFFMLDSRADWAMIKELKAIRTSLAEDGELDISYIGLSEASA